MQKLFIVLLLSILAIPAAAFAGTVQTMEKEELKAMLDSVDLVVLDVRRGRDWSASEFKIKGAVRLAPDEVAAAITRYGKEKTLVFYCA